MNPTSVVKAYLARKGANPLARLQKMPLPKLWIFLGSLGFEVEETVLVVKDKNAKYTYFPNGHMDFYKGLKDREVPSVPTRLEAGQTVYVNVSEPIPVDQVPMGGGPGYRVNYEMYLGWDAVIVTPPEGAPLTLKASSSFDRVRPGATFWKWLAAQPAMAGFLSAPSPPSESSLGPSKMRTLDNTGTCSCCFTNVKLRNGHIVLHGYQRPGWGSVQGECPGVGWKPFEVSPEGTKAFKERLLRVLKTAEEDREKMAKGEVPELAHPVFARRKLTKETATPEEWQRAIEHALPAADAKIRYLKADIATLDTKIREWKAQPLILSSSPKP